jgi:Outer membrane protein beta-barrel domain
MTIQENEAAFVKHCLRVTFFLCVSVLIFSSLLSAQEEPVTPRLQIFAGYSRLQYDSKTFGFSDSTGLNGGTASAAYNLTPVFGVRGEIGIQTGPNIRVRDWLVGPQLMYGKWHTLLFGHVLFGRADTRVSTTVVEKETGRAIAFGGGADYPISERFSIRIIQFDYLQTHALNADQNNLKFSTGVVFHWGALRKGRRKL